MTDNYVYVGYVTGVFGIHGEVRCVFESNHIDSFLKINKYLYINNKKYTINSIKKINSLFILGFNEIYDITRVDAILKHDIFIDRLDYPEIDYFTSELINLKIIDENNKIVGSVKEVLYNKNNLLIKDDNLIIPIVDKYVKSIDVKKGSINVCDIEELRLWKLIF